MMQLALQIEVPESLYWCPSCLALWRSNSEGVMLSLEPWVEKPDGAEEKVCSVCNKQKATTQGRQVGS